VSDNDVSVRFGADTNDLQAGIQKAASSINGFGAQVASTAQSSGNSFNALSQAIQNTGSSSDSWFTRIAETMAAIPAIVSAGLGTVTGIALSVGNAAREAANQLNAPVEAISKFAPVAAAAGVSLQSFGTEFAKLDDNLRKGDKSTQDALKALKIDPAAFRAEDASQQIQTIVDSLHGLQDNFARTAAATALFGSSAQGLMSVADLTTAQLDQLKTMADRTGTTIGSDLSAKMQGTQTILNQVTLNFREAGESVKGLAITAYEQLKPAIDFFLQSFADTVAMLTHWVEGVNNATKAGGGLNSTLMFLKEALLDVAAAGRVFASNFAEIFTTVTSVAIKAFTGVHDIATSIWSDIGGVWSRALQALVASAQEAVSAIGRLFIDLGTTIKAAITFNDASAAFDDLKAHVTGSVDAIKASVATIAPSAAVDAWHTMTTGISADTAKFSADLVAKFKETHDQLQQQWQKPITAPVVKLPSAGNLPGAATDNTAAIRTAQAEAEAEVQAAQQAFKEKQALLDFQLKAHQINDAQMSASTKDALQDQLQDTLAAYDKELQTAGLTSAQIISIKAKETKAIADNNLEVQRLNQDAALKNVQSWESAFSTINSAFTSQISGLVKGTTNFGTAFKNILSTLATDVIKFCAEWALKQAETVALNIVGINAQTAAGVAGANAVSAAQVSAAATSVGTTIAQIGKNIAAYAAEAFAGVTAFLSSIMGPAAVGVAAGVETTVLAAGSAIPSFAVGSWSLPSDMIAQVHQGEMIVPAGPAQTLRDAVSGGGGGSSGGAGSSMVVNFAVNHNSTLTDAQANAWARTIQKALNRTNALNPSLRPA
jgi:hypothetical protein